MGCWRDSRHRAGRTCWSRQIADRTCRSRHIADQTMWRVELGELYAKGIVGIDLSGFVGTNGWVL